MPTTFSKAEGGDRVLALFKLAEPVLHREFAALIGSINSQWTIDYLTRLLESGQIDRAFQALTAHIGRFSAGVNRMYMTAGASAADEATKAFARVVENLPQRVVETAYQQFQREFFETSITISFDQVNERAVEAMRLNKLRLVREFTNAQRLATQSAIRQGIIEGINPRQTARLIRSSVGLTQYQQNVVNNYRNALLSGSTEALTRQLRDRRFDPTVLRAAREGRILTMDQIDRMTERYAERWRNFRAETIARTEALRAVHEGDRQGWEQATARINEIPGLKAELVRTWIATADDRTRDSHAEMDGQEVGIDEPFVSGNGHFLMYPGDPTAPPEETIQCRCVVSTTFRADPA